MSTKPTLTPADFEWAAQQLNCEVAAIKAVDYVESRGTGFLEEGQPVILFERHIFHKLTNGAWTAPDNYNISYPKPGAYGSPGQHQHDRLAKAVALDRKSALMSASWGRYQIMGFNFDQAGHPTLQSFINAMYESERAQLEAFVAFLRSQGLDKYLRNHQWAAFAGGYNGRAFRKNMYDTKLASAYRRFKSK